MYRIDFRPDINLLDIGWSTLFTPELVADYTRIVKARFLEEGFKPGYLLRMDMTDSAVQPREALAAFAIHMADFPKARRIAIITPSAIARMQVRRIMTQPYLRIFDTAAESLGWLVSGDGEANDGAATGGEV